MKIKKDLFTLDQFHSIANYEYREQAPEKFRHLTFKDALYVFQQNKNTNLDDIEECIGKVFCHFLEAVLSEVLLPNEFFSDDEYLDSHPKFWINDGQPTLNCECTVRVVYERNSNYAVFNVGYSFSISDIETEQVFKTALSTIEDNIKSQIIGVYQNESDS